MESKKINIEGFFEKLDGGTIPQVVNLSPLKRDDIFTDIKSILVGRGRLQTKFIVNAFGWGGDAIRFFEDTVSAFAKEAEISFRGDLKRDRRNNPIAYHLFVTNKGREFSDFLSALITRMGSEQKIAHKRSVHFKINREKLIKNGKDEQVMDLELGRVYGLIQFKNLSSDDPFPPIVMYDWDANLSIPRDVRVRAERGENTCPMNRMRNNAGFDIDMQYYSSFAFIGFAFDDEKNLYEFVINRGESDDKGKVSTTLSYHKGKGGQSLADALFDIIGPTKKTFEEKTDLRQQLDKLEAATDELCSKNEIEESDFIYIAKERPTYEDGEGYKIGDAIKADKDDVEEEEATEESEDSDSETTESEFEE